MKKIFLFIFLIASVISSAQRGRKEGGFPRFDSVRLGGTNRTVYVRLDTMRFRNSANIEFTIGLGTGSGMTNPMTLLGDIIYGGSSPAGGPTRLAGNTTGTRQYLTQIGTGSVSAAPSWYTVTADDIPDLSATYELLSNKSTNTSLGTSNTLYPSQNAVKTYVDNVAASQTPKAPVDYATAAALAANTYANGTAGVGATITMNATGTVTIDGHVTALNERILIKDESSQLENGIYTVTTAGAGGVAGVFTRRTDFDQAAEIIPGAFTLVLNGSANAGKVYTQTNTVTTVGTDAVAFVQTGGATGGTAWGSITGTLSAQTDLQNALDAKLAIASNLSDLNNAGTARTNLGATTIGGNIFTLTNPSATGYIRTNADNTVTHRSYANTKVDLSLDNVENTALSTWAGSTNITTLGTIGTGTWNGGVIIGTYGGTGVNNGTKTITLANNLVTSGNFSLTLTQTGTTNITLPTTGTITTLAGTETFTNKRITKRTGTVASSATPTINTDNVDYFSITALAVPINTMSSNLTGTPTEGQTLWIAIKDDGTARALAWGASFEASTVPLPTTTVLGVRLDCFFIWNSFGGVNKWRIVASQ